MSDEIRVLGIDLASRSWRDNGSAILTFSAGCPPNWSGVECGCIDWPDEELTPQAMARVIERTVAQRGLSAVSLDGPQGWREPEAGKRAGVGRQCEYEARCQGKTGEYGKTYPQTQCGWIKFCIDVFGELARSGKAQIVEAAENGPLKPLGNGAFWLLECFPTSTWRSSNLTALPGKSRIGKNAQLIASFARSLHERYCLPGLVPWQKTHDDLQAVVAALPAAALLGGPCKAKPLGKPGRTIGTVGGIPEHRTEGIIWDATPLDSQLSEPVTMPKLPTIERPRRPNDDADAENPLLIDDRDDNGESLLERGVHLFRELVERANRGEPTGVGYAKFACHLHDAKKFDDIANRPYARSDTRFVLRLADETTKAAGGPHRLAREGVHFNAGMDAFIWCEEPPHSRPPEAFEDGDYSESEWKAVFPDGERNLLPLPVDGDANRDESEQRSKPKTETVTRPKGPFKELISLVKKLTPKSDLAKFRNEFRDIASGFSDQACSLLMDARDTIESWATGTAADAQAAVDAWLALREQAAGLLSEEFLATLLRKLPTDKAKMEHWRSFMAGCRSRAIIDAIIGSQQVTKKQLADWIIDTPKEFYQSIALDVAIEGGNLKASPGLWRDLVSVGDRPVGLMSQAAVLVAVYERWNDGKADAAFCASLAVATEAKRMELFAHVLAIPLVAERIAQALALQSIQPSNEGAGICEAIDHFIRYCEATIRQSNRSEAIVVASAAMGAFRLRQFFLRPIPGRGAEDVIGEEAAREASISAGLHIVHRLEEDISDAASGAYFALRGGDMQTLVREHLAGLRTAAARESEPLESGATYQRYVGQKEVLQKIIALLDQQFDAGEMRDELEVLLINSGVSTLGEIGERTKFDSRLHFCPASGILPEEEVKIIRRGFVLGAGTEAIVLSKALVRPVEE